MELELVLGIKHLPKNNLEMIVYLAMQKQLKTLQKVPSRVCREVVRTGARKGRTAYHERRIGIGAKLESKPYV